MELDTVRSTHVKLRDKYATSDQNKLAPSRIGMQFYCEKKVALTEELGDIETPEKQQGTATHEAAAAEAVEVSDDEIWDAIKSGDRTVVIETGFVAEAAEFLFGGIPDAVVFKDQRPKLVFDRKTTARPTRLYDNQQIQVWLYAFMLDRIGFETDDLQIAILSHDRSIDEATAKDLQDLVLSQFSAWGAGTNELSPNAVVHLIDYTPIGFLNELDWALGYWRGEREPEPTTSPAKCRACEYESQCPDSLA